MMGGAKTRRTRGPPNRMNDLSYTEWMKFQKSFYRHKSFADLIGECICFFTKSVWDDGRPSRSLVVGFPDSSVIGVPGSRQVTFIKSQFPECLDDLESLWEKGDRFDYLMVDLFDNAHLQPAVYAESVKHLDTLFKSLNMLLRPRRYCGIVSNASQSLGSSFPIPWSISYRGRVFLRLRDEKIGLMNDNKAYHMIFFQNTPDKRPPLDFSPQRVFMAPERLPVPSWIIPKPPPRRKNVLLHPAKFPETLIEEFIKIFTKEGDSVLDPMVGTGSAVLAATRLGRNGYGIDLSEKFVKIARQRLREEFPLTLFKEDMEERPDYKIICDDATKLNEIDELTSVSFHYCVTSPPYWSMLRNRGSEYQRSRRRKALPLVYSDDERDLGNIRDYETFLRILVGIYDAVASKLVESGYLSVIVKNVKRNHVIYPLAWDIVLKLCGPAGPYDYIGNTFWCQDDISMKPFAVGIHWVSNTVHQYCLHFRKRSKPTGENKKR